MTVCCQCWHWKSNWELIRIWHSDRVEAFGLWRTVFVQMHLGSQETWKETWFRAIVPLMAWNKSFFFPSIYNKAPITARLNMQYPQNASLSCQLTIAHWIPDWGTIISSARCFYRWPCTNSVLPANWLKGWCGGGCQSILQNRQLSCISCSRGTYYKLYLRAMMRWIIIQSEHKKSCPSALATSYSPIYYP